jgi:hypothetical protein
MSDLQTIPDMEAERAWRLARPNTDFPARADRDANEDRIRRLDTLIAAARNLKPKPPPPATFPPELLVMAIVFLVLAMFLGA